MIGEKERSGRIAYCLVGKGTKRLESCPFPLNRAQISPDGVLRFENALIIKMRSRTRPIGGIRTRSWLVPAEHVFRKSKGLEALAKKKKSRAEEQHTALVGKGTRRWESRPLPPNRANSHRGCVERAKERNKSRLEPE